MRARVLTAQFTLLLVLILTATACRPRNEGSSGIRGTEGDAPAGSSTSMVEAIHRAGLDVNNVPVITPAQYYRDNYGGASATIKRAFLQNLLSLFLGNQSPAIIKYVVETCFGVQLPPAPEPSVGGISERLYISNAIAKVFVAVEANPDLLNRFPNIPLEQSNGLQASLFGDPNSTPLAAMAFPAAPATTTGTVLKNDGCTFEDWPAKPAYGNLSIGFKYIREGVVPCFHENSASLAEQINRLANNNPGNPRPYSFSLTLPGSTEASTVTNYEELLKVLHTGGYTVEIFTSRVLVEFESLFVQTPTERKSLRALTWASLPGPNGRIYYPAEHGEIGILIHKDGKRMAQVRWYGGLPDKSLPGLFAFWRPTPGLASPWNGIQQEDIEVYGPGSDVSKATQWFNAATSAMLGFVEFQRKYKPKYNAYGLFVCTDSLVVAMAKLGELRGSSERISKAFPIVRPANAPGEAAGTHTIDRQLEQAMGMAEGSLTKVYPTDPEFYGAARAADPTSVIPAQFKDRLNKAFPVSEKVRLKEFPEAVGTMQATVW